MIEQYMQLYKCQEAYNFTLACSTFKVAGSHMKLQPMFELYFPIALIFGPKNQNTKGIGIFSTAKIPNTLVAHPFPKRRYIGGTTSGNAAARTLRTNVFAAMALAPQRGNVSMM